MKTAHSADIFLPLSRRPDVALHVQLERQLRRAIQEGRLLAQTKMPSTRALAADLDLSRGVVVEAYEQLVAEGYLTSTTGSGTHVVAVHPEPLTNTEAEPVKVHVQHDFQPGIPDLAGIPCRSWLACLQRAFSSSGRDELNYPDPRGPLATRQAIAAYLGRSRATRGHADRIVLCNGFTQGIDLVARLFRVRGVRQVAIEDPGFGRLEKIFGSLGIGVDPIPVDDEGLVVEHLRQSEATAVVLAPAHQFPTGSGLSIRRRTDLLSWARHRNAFIVEDDYDSEYRYDREPLGSLQGLAPERVLYIGTASKILSPAFRLGWLLSPPDVASELARLKRYTDGGSSTFDQLAFAEFLRSGSLERHLRRMRTIYRGRRALLLTALREHLSELPIHGLSAGLHVMVDLPGGTDERKLAREALKRSVRIYTCGAFRIRPCPERPAMILGYGNAQESFIEEGVKRLSDILGQRQAGEHH